MSHQGGQYRRGVAQLVEHVLFAPSIKIFSVYTTILVMGLSLIPVHAGWYSLLSTESNKVELRTKKPAELVTDAQNSAQTKSTVFTVFLVILFLAELGGLGYAVFRYEDY